MGPREHIGYESLPIKTKLNEERSTIDQRKEKELNTKFIKSQKNVCNISKNIPMISYINKI